MNSPNQLTDAVLMRIFEAAFMTADGPLTIDKLQQLIDEEQRPPAQIVRRVLDLLAKESEQRSCELVEVASGWRLQVRQEYAPWVARLFDEKPKRYSRALLETLAIIAYRQPVTRGEIEEVRGVAVSSNVMRTLQERNWVRVVGHREVPGRPAMYASTKEFLDYFNLKSLDQLPSLAELQDIDKINVDLELNSPDLDDPQGKPLAMPAANQQANNLEMELEMPVNPTRGDN